jgi:hypothetical protein
MPRFDECRDGDAGKHQRGRGGDEVVHGVGDDHGPSSLRKAPLTATVGGAMLLISLYVRRILTASHQAASETATGAR